MNRTIDNLEKLRLQFLGLANQTGNTGYSKIEQQMIKEINDLKDQWEEIQSQDILFKKLLKLKNFDAELTEYFEDCLKGDSRNFDYYHEDIDFNFYDIRGSLSFDRGDYYTPPSVDMDIQSYEVKASFYDEETDKDYEDVILNDTLLELLRIKLNIDE